MDNPSMTPAAIAAGIRAALDRAGYSVNRTAELTGIPRATLTRRLLGLSPFNTTELASIASLLGLDDFTTLVRQSAPPEPAPETGAAA